MLLLHGLGELWQPEPFALMCLLNKKNWSVSWHGLETFPRLLRARWGLLALDGR